MLKRCKEKETHTHTIGGDMYSCWKRVCRFLKKKSGMVVPACNPSYLESGGRRITV
jgi:hypothetical protein